MVVTKSWRPPGSATFSDGASPDSLLTVRIRRRSRDAIAPGSVASRVQLLSKLRGSLTPKPQTLVPKHAREDSRSGFGRRVNSRFGNPAIQSGQPDATPLDRVESRHSFLGLNIARTNHGEEHGIVDGNIPYNRSSGGNGQREPRADTRKRCDTVSQSGATSRATAAPSGGRSFDLDVLKEIDSSGNHKQTMTQISIFPSPATKDNANMYRRQFQTRQSSFKESEASIATTSSTRRQDVRDLFDEYGIQRPAGLASREVSYDVGGQSKYCHVCSWIDSRASIKCSRCHHLFCFLCKDHLPPECQEDRPASVEDPSGVCQSSRLMPKENQNIEEDPVKQFRPGPSPLQRKPAYTATPRKASSPPVRFSDFYEPLPDAKPPREISSEQNPVSACFTYGPRATASLKNNPFVIADQNSPRESLRLVAARMEKDTQHTPYHRTKPHRVVKFPSTPSETASCGSRSYRTTPVENLAVRQAASCGSKKTKGRVAEDTEVGHSTDTSRVEDAFDHSFRCHSQTSRADPCRTQDTTCSHLTCPSGLDSSHSLVLTDDCPSSKHDVPEFVECRGYPRTGHARHGSPISTGVVGQCQHCLDDCQCAACQNTHHSVRCCVHTDHKPVVHHHHTPAKKARSPCPEGSSTKQVNRSPLPACAVSPPGPLPTLEGVEAQVALSSEVSTKTRDPSSSTSNPYAESAAQSTTTLSTAKNESVEHDVANVTESTLSEASAISPRTSREQLSFEVSAEPADGTWFRIPSHHELEQNHERRASWSTPLRKKSVAREHATSPDPRSPRTEGSPPRSRKPSRTKSTLYQLNKKIFSGAVDQQLPEHPTEVGENQKDCGGPCSRNAVAELANKFEQRESRISQIESRKPSASRRGAAGSKRKNWKLKLVDRDPKSRKVAGQQHDLRDDEIVVEGQEKDGFKSQPSILAASLDWMEEMMVGGKEHNLSVDEAVAEVDREYAIDHECVWKKRFEGVRSKKEDLGIQGITILIHLVGRKDLVARAESWTGGETNGED
ncbi:hypothetical protein BUE80_DR004643 [Diplocarpon rosae]|nr:hypothetical protein BUE80_DR004643 [Diplocarpon rosae]